MVQNIPLCTWMYLYMVGPSHKVSSRRETDGRQMSFRSWTLQLIKCLNGVGNFICCKMHVVYFITNGFEFNIKLMIIYFDILRKIHTSFIQILRWHKFFMKKNYGKIFPWNDKVRYYAFDIEFRNSRYQIHYRQKTLLGISLDLFPSYNLLTTSRQFIWDGTCWA